MHPPLKKEGKNLYQLGGSEKKKVVQFVVIITSHVMKLLLKKNPVVKFCNSKKTQNISILSRLLMGMKFVISANFMGIHEPLIINASCSNDFHNCTSSSS